MRAHLAEHPLQGEQPVVRGVRMQAEVGAVRSLLAVLVVGRHVRLPGVQHRVKENLERRVRAKRERKAHLKAARDELEEEPPSYVA